MFDTYRELMERCRNSDKLWIVALPALPLLVAATGLILLYFYGPTYR